jgi:hypothetical protein
MFCDRPTPSRSSVVFIGPRANAELVPKFHVALHGSHAALPMVTLQISPYTNFTSSFDFDFGLDHPVHGGYGWGRHTWRRKKVIDELADWPSVAIYLTLICVVALQITYPSSRQRRHLTWRRKTFVTQSNVKSGHLLQRRPNTKTNWSTDVGRNIAWTRTWLIDQVLLRTVRRRVWITSP